METGNSDSAGSMPVPPLALADGVYWLGVRNRDEHLSANSYALMEGGHAWVIDPGSAAAWPVVRRALEALFEMYGVAGEHQSYSIVATGPDISSMGCVSAGRDALALSSGARPEKLIIHWRAAMLAGALDVGVEYVDVGEQAIVLGEERVIQAMQLAPHSRNGRIALYDEARQVFFSGAVFGSLGADLPLMDVSGADDEEQARAIPGLRSYYHQFSDPGWIDALRDENHPHWSMSERLVCPRFGAVRRNTVSELLGLLASEPAQLPEVFQDPQITDSDELAGFLEETQELEGLGFIPAPDMQLLDDSRVQDDETPLLNSEFFDELATRLINGAQASVGANASGVAQASGEVAGAADTRGRGVVVFAQLDGLGKLITEHGYGEGDKAIRTFSSIILGVRSETALSFHLFGSDFAVLLPHGDKSAGVALAERLRTAIAESSGFLTHLTATFSVVSASEVTSLASLRERGRARLRYAWSQERGSICADVPEGAFSDSAGASSAGARTRVLIVEPDSFTSTLFSEFLTGEGYECGVCAHGVRAFDAVLEYRPHIIIADVFLAGSDVFRLREALAARSETAGIPVVICSYMKDDVTVRRAHALGMYHLLKKPVELSELSGLAAGYARAPEVFAEWSS